MKHKVTINPSGIEFEQHENETILDAALKQDFPLQYSCKVGDCGICTATIIKGSIQDQDGKIIEQGDILTCSSIAITDLILNAVYFPELKGIKEQSLSCKVSEIYYPTEDICILILRFPPSVNFEYLPGQYVDLKYKGISRSYSIANAKNESRNIELHIRKIPEGRFSSMIFSEIKENTLLQLSGPKGTFFLRNNDRPIICIAGGTGFAPIKAIMETLTDNKDNRNIYVYWGMPHGKDFYMHDAEKWADKFNNIVFVPVVSGKDPEWQGRIGLVHHVVLEDFKNLESYDVYACGSPAMIRVAKQDLLKLGLPSDRFYSDAFTPSK